VLIFTCMSEEGTASPYQRAVRAVGGGAALGRLLGISQPAVSQWQIKGIPPDRVLDIERVTGVSRHELRPDIYGYESAEPGQSA